MSNRRIPGYQSLEPASFSDSDFIHHKLQSLTLLFGLINAPGISVVDLAVMLAIAVAQLPLCKSGGKISRIEAAVLLVVYVGYTWWLIANNAG